MSERERALNLSQALLDNTNRAAMADSVQINKSLFTLRKARGGSLAPAAWLPCCSPSHPVLPPSQVIIALSETSAKPRASKAHVPYRDGTLTRLLKQALGGNSYTLMVRAGVQWWWWRRRWW